MSDRSCPYCSGTGRVAGRLPPHVEYITHPYEARCTLRRLSEELADDEVVSVAFLLLQRYGESGAQREARRVVASLDPASRAALLAALSGADG